MARPFLVASVDVEGSILVLMMARRVSLAVRVRLAVRRLRGLCWASIVCGTLSF